MKKYAVIQIQGKQYKVQEGDKLTLDRLDSEENKKFTISDVLLVVDGSSKKIGQPLVKDAKVELKVLSHQKGKKLRVAKFKAKSRYRKVKGHRQHETSVEVIKIA